ncbi:energy-coupling factor ABC transporter ATP-binding protein [Acidobacteriota bacterium]
MNETQLIPAVEVEHLSFAYEDKKVLDDVSLTVEEGECFGIIGPSGAGKSTLLLHLNGILFGEGIVRVCGMEVQKESLFEVRQRLGLVFQNPDDQLFNPTVEEDVAFGPLNMELTPEEVRRRVETTLKLMDLAGFENKTSHHLSFGERKRVALATVLAMDPEIIAFDEPFSNLDPKTIRQFIDTLEKLDSTIILVSQQILPALACCDRLAVLKNGHVVKVGSPEEIASDRSMLQTCGLDFTFYVDILRRLGLG